VSSSWTLNAALINRIHTMFYSVQIKRNPFKQEDHTFADAYFQGSERTFENEQEAVDYFQSFEDWEQDLLVIESFPF
jgi:hypothetical protein